jgi:hypothetical protein
MEFWSVYNILTYNVITIFRVNVFVEVLEALI